MTSKSFKSFWKIELQTPRILTESVGQAKLKLWFLFYRWFLALCWISITIISATECCTWQPYYQIEKYLIYLTNWDLILGSIQALLGATLVTNRWRLQNTPGFDADQMNLTKCAKTFWLLNVAVFSVAVTVTVIYWAVLYKPERDFLDPQNILTHACNTLLMLIDVAVSKVPFRLISVWWSLVVVLVFLIFSGFYQLAGGTNLWYDPYIYKVLDWRNLQTVFKTSFAVVVLICLAHSLICGLLSLRDSLIEKYMLKNEVASDENATNSVL